MTVIETYEKNGWTCTLMQDESPPNPRDDDVHFLWVGAGNRQQGDEWVHDDMGCPNEGCEYGFLYNEATASTDLVCPLCEGNGSAIDMDMLEKFVIHLYEPLHIGRVAYDEHGPQCRYFLDDHGRQGFLLYTPEKKEMWGGDPTPEQLDEDMRNELQEYTDWCNGSVYGYVLTDINGTEHDSCWGLVGDYGFEEAKRALNTFADDPQPEMLRNYRFTDREVAHIVQSVRLAAAPDATNPVADSILAKLNGAT